MKALPAAFVFFLLGASAAPAQDVSWWAMFRDDRLDRLEREAVAANSDLKGAVARVSEAQARAGSAGSDRFPTLTAPLSAVRQRTTNTGPVESSRLAGEGFPGFPPNASFSAQALSNTYNDFQAPLEAAYEVDVFGRIGHAYGQARAEARASLAERDAVRLSLTSQVAADYFALRAADSMVAVLRRTARLRADAVSIQEQRVKAGAASDLDLLRARVERENTEAELSDATQQRAELENDLAVLCGETPGEFHIASQPLDSGPPPPMPATVSEPSIVGRPDLIEAQLRVVAATEGAKAARARLYPSVKVRVDYGYDSARTNQLLEAQSREWLIGGAIDIPIFDGRKNSSEFKAAQAQVDEALAAYHQATASALREAEDALSELRQRAAQAEARRRATDDSRKVFEASQRSYDQGGMTYFEVIDAERSLLDAELSQVRTLNQRYAATIGLVRATGGNPGVNSAER